MKRNVGVVCKLVLSLMREAVTFLASVPIFLLIALLAEMLLFASVAVANYALRFRVNISFPTSPQYASKIVFVFVFSVAFLLSLALIGKATVATSVQLRGITAVAKAVTVVALASTGVAAARWSIWVPRITGPREEPWGGVTTASLGGYLPVRTMTTGEFQLVIAVILFTILAAISAVVVSYRVLRKTITADVAEALFATTTAVATFAVAGTVIMILSTAIFLRLLGAVLVVSLLGLAIVFVPTRVATVLRKIRK